jgi:hypothetical protein
MRRAALAGRWRWKSVAAGVDRDRRPDRGRGQQGQGCRCGQGRTQTMCLQAELAGMARADILMLKGVFSRMCHCRQLAQAE